MMKLAIGLVATIALLMGSLLVVQPKEKDPVSTLQTEAKVQEAFPLPERPSIATNSAFKIFPADKTITLEAANTVVLRGPVSRQSVSELQAQIEELRQNLSDNEVIYLVLDTPGGSVIAGMDFIDYLKALPNKVQTITLFAASMGFQIAQNLDTRYITETGTLMSHRASGGVEGQFDGELESQYKMIKRKIDYLDTIASKRMGISLEDYKAMIKDEYWVSGFDSVEEKAADQKVNLRCGKSMSGTTKGEVSVLFFSVEAEFSKCPLIRGPVKVNMSKVAPENVNEVNRVFNMAYKNQRQFLKEIVLPNKTDYYFK